MLDYCISMLLEQEIIVIFLLCCLMLAMLVLYFSSVYVEPGSCYLYMTLQGVKCVNTGYNVISPLSWPIRSSWNRNVGRRNSSRYVCPAPKSKLILDPPAVPFHSKDRVSGTLDVNIECVVTEWDPMDVIQDKSDLKTKACQRINQLLCVQLVKIAADECTYGKISQYLNSEEIIFNLNEKLKECYLKVNRICLDPQGISLSPEYVRERKAINVEFQTLDARERLLTRKVEIDELERQVKQKEYDFELAHALQEGDQKNESLKRNQMTEANAEAERKKIEAESEFECAKLRAQAKHIEADAEFYHIQKLISAGLPAEQVSKMLIVEQGRNVLKNCGDASKIISVPPGLLGLHGNENLSWAKI